MDISDKTFKTTETCNTFNSDISLQFIISIDYYINEISK